MFFKSSTKSLVAILNHNLPEYTDHVFDILNENKDNTYDIAVIDNGSEPGNRSRNTTHQIEKNGYFGGGINYAFHLVLDNKKYDSLLFLNNDIVFHGQNFVRTLRDALFNEGHAIVSPVVLQPERNQPYWKMMHNWGSKETRRVRWADFQAPMISRKLIEKINQFPDELFYGYGQDILAGLICEDEGWTVGVCDYLSIIHYRSLTTRKEVADISYSDYREKAQEAMDNYFKSINEERRYMDFIQYARTYCFNPKID